MFIDCLGAHSGNGDGGSTHPYRANGANRGRSLYRPGDHEAFSCQGR
jgi:hypothetical protein